MTTISNKELIELSNLLKKQKNLLGDSKQEKEQKHNIKVMRKFIDQIRDGRINKLIDITKNKIRRLEHETIN